MHKMAPSHRRPPTIPAQGRWTILVVDDEQDALDEIRSVIEADGDICYTSESAEDAFAKLESDPSIGIVISDVRMPGIDGLEFVSRLSARRAPMIDRQFIMMSGYANFDSMQLAIRLRVHDFLQKPLSLSAVRGTIASAKLKVAGKVSDPVVPESISIGPKTQSLHARKPPKALKQFDSGTAVHAEGPFARADPRDFASVLSRQLRSPLEPILSMSALMRKAELATIELVKGYGTTIHAEATKAANILDRVLEYYSVETGEIQLHNSEINISYLIQRIVVSYSRSVDDRPILLSVDSSMNLPEVSCDPLRIGQAFAHLLSNAIRFSSKPGMIEVSVRIQHGIVELRVADQGDGLSPEEAKLALLPFKRDVNAKATRRYGTGLGLTLASLFARLHGGQVRIESRKGGGTEAILAFPVSSRAAEGEGEGTRLSSGLNAPP